MSNYSNRYNREDVEKWAKMYSECYSFGKVSRFFGADPATIKNRISIIKDEIGLIFKDDLLKFGKKWCYGCKNILSLEMFGSRSSRKDGHNGLCFECEKHKLKQWYYNNLDHARNKGKIYTSNYRRNNKDRVKESKRAWENNNPEKYKTGNNKRSQKYRERNKNNIQFRLRYLIRSRLRSYISRKSGLTDLIDNNIGCSYLELKKYLEERFYRNPDTGEDMTWNNWIRDGWHIDHIIPLSSFDLSDNEQFRKATHYTNLQPLWAKENLKKGSKV